MRTHLKHGVSLVGKYWKGTYAYLEPNELKQTLLSGQERSIRRAVC